MDHKLSCLTPRLHRSRQNINQTPIKIEMVVFVPQFILKVEKHPVGCHRRVIKYLENYVTAVKVIQTSN
jgi:hypothetical protein